MKRGLKGLLINLVLIAILAGCQGVFTYSPLSFLKRNPDDLPLEQRIDQAEDALASGDQDAMADAYDSIKDDASDSSDAELTLLAANLALELSGVPELAIDLMAGDVDYNVTDFNNFLQDSVETEYLVEAADHYENTLNNDSSALTGTDYLVGAASILFAAGEESGGGSIESLTAAEVADAENFVDAGIANLPADDPAQDYLLDLQTFLNDNYT